MAGKYLVCRECGYHILGYHKQEIGNEDCKCPNCGCINYKLINEVDFDKKYKNIPKFEKVEDVVNYFQF
jgi:Zn finger protein HypA/HybF involved in hydrogenase expression